MRLTLLSPDAGLADLSMWLGVEPASDLGLAELIRAEVTARGTTPRATALERVRRFVAPVANIDPKPLARTCDVLVREGDLVLGAGGRLAATPLRLVRLGQIARVSSSLPTPALQAALGADVERRGLTRRVAWTDASQAALTALGGLALTLEQWAGLDRAPLADHGFLQRLDQRLQCAAAVPADHVQGEPVEWRGWTWHGDRWAWRRDAGSTPLWRAKTAWGHLSAWTTGGSPGTTPFFELPPDDSARARFALARHDGRPLVVSVQIADDVACFSLPGWLPRAEYRWLSLLSEPGLDAGSGNWRVPASEFPRVRDLLVQRLGVIVEDA